MSTKVLTTLKKAAKGLMYVSETDAPFEPFLWPQPGKAISKAGVLTQLNLKKNSPAAEIAFAAFFQGLTEPRDWHGPAEKAKIKKFQALAKTLESQLTDLCVFKIGETQFRIVIVGATADGDWAGVMTEAVET